MSVNRPLDGVTLPGRLGVLGVLGSKSQLAGFASSRGECPPDVGQVSGSLSLGHNLVDKGLSDRIDSAIIRYIIFERVVRDVNNINSVDSSFVFFLAFLQRF